MLPLKTLLCPVDFSRSSDEALKIAGELAQHFGACIYIVHVLELTPSASSSFPPAVATAELHRKELEERAADTITTAVEQFVPDGVYVFPMIEIGQPALEILRIAGAKSADLIVIPTHGRTGWRRLVFGSVAEEVLRQAQCPVLTIRAGGDETNETSAAA